MLVHRTKETRCEPLVQVVQTADGALVFTGEISRLGDESCLVLSKPTELG